METPRAINAHRLAGRDWPQALYSPSLTACGWWGPARPLPYCSIFERWRLAFAVLTGRADALFWAPPTGEPTP